MPATTKKNHVRAINDYLLSHTGATLGVLGKVFGEKVDARPSFFKPLNSKKEGFYEAASVVTAPICFATLTAEMAVGTVFYALKPLVDLVMLKPAEAAKSLKTSLSCLIGTICFLISAVLSPFINLTAAIGSACTRALSDDRAVSHAPSMV